MLSRLLVAIAGIAMHFLLMWWIVRRADRIGYMRGWDAAANFMCEERRRMYPEFCEVRREGVNDENA